LNVVNGPALVVFVPVFQQRLNIVKQFEKALGSGLMNCNNEKINAGPVQAIHDGDIE
jgi:hypothetical protein